MDIFSVLILCSIYELTFSQSESGFLHTRIEAGGKLEPDINLNGLYTKDQKRKWSLYAEEGVWALIFKKFSLERSDGCRFDYLQIEEIYNSTFEAPIQPTRYCGEKLPRPYVSTSPRVEIRFVTDNLFEHDGFLIHVMHSTDEVALRKKVYSLEENGESARLADKKEDNASLTTNNSVFYILVGCSIAALLLFVILLAYFVHSIRKVEGIPPSRLQEPYYIRATSINMNNQQPDVVNLPDKDAFVCKLGKTGKRYLKDNNNKDKTSKKFVAQTHHNNLYVSEKMTSNS